ncbi:hypothetical protein [Pedobacter sp. N36a]|uniref:hypothetical protein n=1 Tax=Pedobacter sp. N36a TaxID=2767996 RepID=UPI001CA43A73|nr:hypothetical protein [Pedobacter sp. N36a]
MVISILTLCFLWSSSFYSRGFSSFLQVLHFCQIFYSVITEWLKEKDLRTVQYMAGHKYVSSTERYQTTTLEDLKEALNKHHPLNK